MSKKRTMTCCLVIDASIAFAAGKLESGNPQATCCREFLETVRRVCHRMAWSEAIKVEWDRRQNSFAAAWRASMMSLRKLHPVKDEWSEELRTAIEGHSDDQHVTTLMIKDAHLIEAALATDTRVASLDEKARGHFARPAPTFDPLQQVMWVNPAIDNEQTIDWLEKGAPAQRARRLKA